MINNIFLDTNIIFDIIDTNRVNNSLVKKLLKYGHEKNIKFFISAISINNIIYVMENKFKMPAEILKDNIKKLISFFEIIPYDLETIIDGLKINLKDIEDSFQFISALKSKSKYLITEDKKFLNFKIQNKQIEIISTTDFLNRGVL